MSLQRLTSGIGTRAITVAAIAAVVVVIVLVVVWPKSEAETQVQFGFNNNAVSYNQATPDQSAAMIAAAGGDIDRVQVEWASFEPSPGERRFEFFDAIYRADIAHGVKPLFIIASAPAWATDAECATAPTPCHAAPSPPHYDDMARTAAAFARRYPRAAGIEIWNEPNAPFFWAPTPDPAAYAELLRKSYRAIKRANPRMAVAGGSTSSGVPSQPPPGQILAADFVSALRANRGFRHMDALSLHAYAQQGDTSGESAIASVERVRAVAKKKTPIWVTETGVTSTGPEAVSEESQALTLTSLSQRLPQLPRVRMILVHTLVEPPGPIDAETGFGVVRGNLQPKPGYCVLGQSWGGDSGC